MTIPGGAGRRVASADLNRDHLLDLIVTAGSEIDTYLGNGDGTFQDAMAAVNAYATCLAFGDLNGDGNVDMAAVEFDLRFVSVLLGKGDGTFQPAVEYGTGPNATAVTIADFDKDGHLDVAVSSAIGLGVSVLRGNGDGTLQPYLGYSLMGGPSDFRVRREWRRQLRYCLGLDLRSGNLAKQRQRHVPRPTPV